MSKPSSYAVNGLAVGAFVADARRRAQRLAAETGTPHVVERDGAPTDLYLRGASGLARLAWCQEDGTPYPGVALDPVNYPTR